MMKRNVAIDTYIHNLEDYEVYNILDTLHDYDGDFKSYIWHPMDEFDERTAYLTHTELMRSEGHISAYVTLGFGLTMGNWKALTPMKFVGRHSVLFQTW